MITRIQKSESGQALILLVVGLVALFGFTALAIDGGSVYSERRYAQNAADTTAMAGALAKINADPNWTDVALGVAANNGFNNDGATNTVQVYNPPISGPFAGSNNHVQAIITEKVDTALVHFIYQGSVENTVEAVVEITPPVSGPLYPGNALVGLNPEACDTVKVGGAADVEISGGSIFVNSKHDECAFHKHGSGNLNVTGGSIDVVGKSKINGSGSITPLPDDGATQVAYPPDPDIPPPVCTGSATVVGDRILPGNYSGAKFPPEGVTNFGDPTDVDGEGNINPQIFCIDVTDKFHLKSNTYIGDSVLFYMINGNVEWNADATILLNPPVTGDYAGLLLFMDPHGYENPPNTYVTINGQSASQISGTIWGPASHCKLNGTGGEESYKLQVICYNIELLGNNNLYIDNSDADLFSLNRPPRLTLSQ